MCEECAGLADLADSLLTERDDLEDNYNELYAVSLEIYEAARWTSSGLSTAQEAFLWETLRDTLGLPEGHATKRGV